MTEKKKLTFDEIEKKLNDLEVTPSMLDGEDSDDDYDDDGEEPGEDDDLDTTELVEKYLGKFKEVHSHGGGEGGGEYVERIYHFIDHDVYVRTTGGYYSHHGIEWDDDFEEVFPRKTIVTVYETKKERGDKQDEC